LVLITNRKSHTDFQLVATSGSLNDREWHNSPYFAIFHLLLANYITVVEDRPIMPAE